MENDKIKKVFRSRQSVLLIAFILAICKHLWVFVTVAVTVLLMSSCATYNDYETEGVPKFVSVNYIDLSQTDEHGEFLIKRISRFRSSEGHDYSDNFESARSMKHYFDRANSDTEIYAPVNGTVLRIQKESSEDIGRQIHIASDLYPSFVFIIFHVKLIKDFVYGEKVKEGQILGHHTSSGNVRSSDMAVRVQTSKGMRLVSYFETLTPEALKPFTDRRADFMNKIIISKAERDAHPLQIKDKDSFVDAESDPLDKYVDF